MPRFRVVENGSTGLALVTLGVFVTALDQTVVVTAIPEIISDLEIDFENIDRAAWIVTAFLIGYAAALPVAGRLADMYATRRIFVAGLAVFAAGSIAAAVASDLWFLVGARFVQAVGGGALVPVALVYAIGSNRGKSAIVAVGIVVAAAEAGGVIGPLWGAAVTHYLSWRWIFYLNIPLSIAMALVIWRVRSARPPVDARVDKTGALLAAGGLILLTAGLARDEALPPLLTPVLLVLGVVTLTTLVFAQRRSNNPMLNVRLFARGAFSSGNLAAALVGGGLIVPMVNIPLYSATVLERDALEGGLLLLRMTILIPVGAIAGGWLATRFGERSVTALGALTAALGLWLASGWPAEPSEVRLARDLVIAGFGFGLLISPLTAAVMNAAGSANFGIAAGIATVSRLIGMMLALAALTPWALSRFNFTVAALPLPIGTGNESKQQLDLMSAEYAQAVTNATVGMFNELFSIGAILCAAAAIPAIFLAGMPLSFRFAKGAKP